MSDLLAKVEGLPRNCTFDAADWKILAGHWYPVALSREVTDAPVAAILLDEPLVIYRLDGRVIVANDICPHRGVPMSMGKLENDGIVCAYHGLRFGADGRCNHIPANPDKGIPEKLHLKTYPVVEKYGLIWTCLQAGANGAGTLGAEDAACSTPAQVAGAPGNTICPMPYWDDPAFQQIVCPWIDIFGFAGRQIEGFLDVAHFGFVHTQTFGDASNTLVPAYTPVPHANGFGVDYWSTVANYPVGVKGAAGPDFQWLRRFNMHLPFTATLVVHFPDDVKLVIMNAASPVSARVTRLFVPIARNFDTDKPVQAVYDFNRKVFEEDKAIVEAQKPECLPLDPKLEAHIPADRSSIAYRKGLRDMGLSRFFIS